MMVNETKAKASVRALSLRHLIQTPFTPHLPSLSISARLFCPGNAPIELPAEKAKGGHTSNILTSSLGLWQTMLA